MKAKQAQKTQPAEAPEIGRSTFSRGGVDIVDKRKSEGDKEEKEEREKNGFFIPKESKDGVMKKDRADSGSSQLERT